MSDQGTEGLLSSYLRQKRINAVKPFLTGKILDIGCGTGALAEWVKSDDYFGMDIDEQSLLLARAAYPCHQFSPVFPKGEEKFNTIAALAVIEHVKSPVDFLVHLSGYLEKSPNARIVCTTPHLLLGWAHTAGAKVGLFSRSANEEHEILFDRKKLKSTAFAAGLKLVLYRRFLFGANQLVVLNRF